MSTESTPTPSARPPVPGPIRPAPDAGAKLLTAARDQGTVGRSNYENLLGSGGALWESDEEFDQFLELVHEIRHAKG